MVDKEEGRGVQWGAEAAHLDLLNIIIMWQSYT